MATLSLSTSVVTPTAGGEYRISLSPSKKSTKKSNAWRLCDYALMIAIAALGGMLLGIVNPLLALAPNRPQNKLTAVPVGVPVVYSRLPSGPSKSALNQLSFMSSCLMVFRSNSWGANGPLFQAHTGLYS
jgi:hypothetical protein